MSRPPHVVLRADANRHIGLGHVSRCLALADALQELGATVTLLARSPDDALRRLVEARHVTVHALTATSETADAEAVRDYLGAYPCDAMVVDHYELGSAWERTVHSLAPVLLAIDDVAREHDTDLLLDQNAGVDTLRPYDGRVPLRCRQLLGPHFALVPRVVREAVRFGHARSGEVARVLVFFGGADHTGETVKALDALSAPEFAHWHVDVVSLAVGAQDQRIRELVASRPHTTLHGQRPHLVDLLVRADLAVGAGGTTTWERLALGVPSLVTLVADNQRQATSTLVRDGAVHFVGEATATTAAHYTRALQACTNAPLAAPPRLVDGWGAMRVAAQLLGARVPFVGSRRTEETGAMSVEVTRGGAPVGRVDVPVDAEIPAQVYADLPADSPSVLRAAVAALKTRSPDAGRFLSLGTANAGTARRIVLLTDAHSWLNDWMPLLAEQLLAEGHAVCWLHDIATAPPADLCFLLGFMQVVPRADRQKFGRMLVVHESAVPEGRGWSPLTWQILEGRHEIPVSLLEAVDDVDAGDVFARTVLHFDGTELVHELRRAQALATMQLCVQHVQQDVAGVLASTSQSGPATVYPRRRPADSALDPAKSLGEQFELLRVVDNDRYPAFFHWRNRKYVLRIQSDDELNS